MIRALHAFQVDLNGASVPSSFERGLVYQAFEQLPTAEQPQSWGY